MELENMILVAFGGAVGAVLRYTVGITLLHVFHGMSFLGTFAVNIIGSFLMGVVVGGVEHTSVRLLLATGCLGGFTTFSAFMFESVDLLQNGMFWQFGSYVLASVVMGIVSLCAGLKVF